MGENRIIEKFLPKFGGILGKLEENAKLNTQKSRDEFIGGVCWI